VLEGLRGPSLEKLAQLREPPHGHRIARDQRAGQGLEPFAEGAEAHHQEAGVGLPPHPGEGGQQAVDALGVDELADVDHEGGIILRGEEGLEPLPDVPVVRAGVVGAGYRVESFGQFSGILRALEGLPQSGVVLRAAPRASAQGFEEGEVEGLGPEEVGVHAAREGRGLLLQIREVLRDGARAVR
jgi:hypothetical protein